MSDAQVPSEQLVEELRERHAPNCFQYSNDDSDLEAAGAALLEAADLIESLLKREYICKQCGIRKDAETVPHDF